MKRALSFIALLAALTLSASDGLDKLVAHYADSAAASASVEKARTWRGELAADGSWPDIDYSNRVRSEWPVGKHLSVRLRALAADWRRNRDRASLEAAHRALGYWTARRFKNPNWWWNVIGVPRAIGDAALMMDDELTDAERKAVVKIMTVDEPNFAKTGQNFAWMSENRLRRGMLTRDPAMVRAALDGVLREVRMGDREGIRSDWCFHQHGEQPQFGNYGLSFLADQARLTALLAGTDFPYPADKLELVRNLAAKGYSWVLWKGHMDVSALGRQLHAGTQTGKCATAERAFRDLEKSGWKRPPSPVGFRYFDKSAYAVYRTADWMASVRASTPRITGVETWINEDNAKGMCMADGALMTYVTGCEYEDVYPLWDDWRMIPGVTAYALKPVDRKDSRNKKDDIRAASAANGGSFEFTFSREGLMAHKRWTFSPEGVLCEGSAITSDDGRWEVVTCIEHARAAKGAGVVYQRDGESCFRNGPLVYTVYAPKEAIRFAIERREGNFNAFMLAHESHPVSGDVFSLRLVHGRAPKDAGYRYRITVDSDFNKQTKGKQP